MNVPAEYEVVSPIVPSERGLFGSLVGVPFLFLSVGVFLLHSANLALGFFQFGLEFIKVLFADPLFDTLDLVLPFGI